MNEALATDRIHALEDALRACVGYLKRMPIVPTTIDQIRAAESVLDASSPPAPLVGESYAPTGIMVVGVTIEGNKATIRTNSPSSLAENLNRSLTNGVTVQLRRQTK